MHKVVQITVFLRYILQRIWLQVYLHKNIQPPCVRLGWRRRKIFKNDDSVLFDFAKFIIILFTMAIKYIAPDWKPNLIV